MPALVLAAALAASGAAWAAEPEVVATAPTAASGAPPSVADQIDTYLNTSPAAILPKDGATGVTSGDGPRTAHGMVDVAVGSNGYRSAFVQSDLPVGKTGTLSIGVGETRFNGRVGDGYGGRFSPSQSQSQTLALGLRMDDAAPGPQDLRCHQAEEVGPDRSADPQFGGGRPNTCQAAGARTAP
jgi:hypothetical protein